MRIEGTVAHKFEPVRKVFERLWQDVEVGASLCVIRQGETIVDLWGGHQDRDSRTPWQADTLVNVYSTTKGMVALALACLVEDGQLDYQRPVIDYWPEFGAEQKFEVTIAQLISHQSGLYRFNPAVAVDDLYDFQKMAFNLASQAPAWTPGAQFAYHSISWGYLAGKIISVITGLTPGQYIAERIAGPLNADFYLGLTDALQARCATLIGPNHARKKMPQRQAPQLKQRLKTADPIITPFRDACSVAWRRAEIPASNGHASAAGLAACFNAALDGQLFSEMTLRQATAEVTNGEIDQVLGYPVRRAMGFILSCDDVWLGPSERAFGHTGTGGSIAFADPDEGISFAYVMNQLHSNGGSRSRLLIESLYQCL